MEIEAIYILLMGIIYEMEAILANIIVQVSMLTAIATNILGPMVVITTKALTTIRHHIQVIILIITMVSQVAHINIVIQAPVILDLQ